MAMTKCSECGHDVSTLAATCPNCGAPLRASPVQPLSGADFQMRLPFKIALGFIAIVVVVAGVASAFRPVAFERARPAVVVSVEELEGAYQQNTLAADARFKGQRLSLTSAVQNINTDIANGAYLVLGRPGQFMAPQAAIAESDRGRAASLHPGDVVSLLCTGAGDIAKMPMLADCRFQSDATAPVQSEDSHADPVAIAKPLGVKEEQPATVTGVLMKGTFENCCENGNSHMQPYFKVHLARPIVFIGPGYSPDPMVDVQLGGLQDGNPGADRQGQVVTMRCERLIEGVTSHYAERAYCENAKPAEQ